MACICRRKRKKKGRKSSVRQSSTAVSQDSDNDDNTDYVSASVCVAGFIEFLSSASSSSWDRDIFMYPV